MDKSIITSFLIISDTHGMGLLPPKYHADVAIHCGDLTQESKIAEFKTSLNMIKALDASLKIVIAGNHDFTLDTPMFRKKIEESGEPLDSELVKKEYGDWGEAEALLKEAKQHGVIFLSEGTHQFVLQNGARLKVYASPFTPSTEDWGFEYDPREGHNFEVEDDTDVVITHGPPRGIMDRAQSRERLGCPNLFASIARSCPRLHCFGHVHGQWGAKLITWRESARNCASPSFFSVIDNEKSKQIQNLEGLYGSRFDDAAMAAEKATLAESCHQKDLCYRTSHCTGVNYPVIAGESTLFVNAAIQGYKDGKYPQHLPWLVNIELPPDVGKSGSSSQEERGLPSVNKRQRGEVDEGQCVESAMLPAKKMRS